MFTCKICNETFEKINGLLTHIQFNHKEHSPESYYRQHIMAVGEGFCKTCGKPTKFNGIKNGYQTYCNRKCVWADPEIKAKRKITNSAKTDSEILEWKIRNKESRLKKNNGNYSPLHDLAKRQEISETHFKEYFAKCNCEFIKYDDKVHFRCNKCGCEDAFTRSVIDRYDRTNDYDVCHYCNDRRFVSSPEREIRKYIETFYEGKIISGDRHVLNGKELDLYFPDKKLAIEYDGFHWHNENRIPAGYHLEKTNACEANGIQLIHIFETEWLNKPEIVKSRIRNLFEGNNRIFARKCSIKEISADAAKAFLQQNHIQGWCCSKWRYGLEYNGELVSLMTFGKSRFKDEYELLRFANKLDTNVIGGASRLFKHFVNDHSEIKKIISFADRRWSVGNLYEKIGFTKIGTTPPSYFYRIDNELKNRVNFQKHKLVANGADPSKTEHEIMKERGYLRIYDCGCLKYEWTDDSQSV